MASRFLHEHSRLSTFFLYCNLNCVDWLETIKRVKRDLVKKPPAWGWGSLPAVVYVLEILSRPSQACPGTTESSGFPRVRRDRAVHEQAEWKCTRGHLRLTLPPTNDRTDRWRKLTLIQWEGLIREKLEVFRVGEEKRVVKRIWSGSCWDSDSEKMFTSCV